ncbi:MAG: PKD domain-containing protein [Thermoplasmata archaeon]|nr:PKD domain-containing protein [Thermoplasmata archaeon]
MNLRYLWAIAGVAILIAFGVLVLAPYQGEAKSADDGSLGGSAQTPMSFDSQMEHELGTPLPPGTSGSYWKFGSAKTCRDVQGSEYECVDPTDQFKDTDDDVNAWIQINDVDAPVRLKCDWYYDGGATYYFGWTSVWVNDPGSPGDGWYWSWVRWYCNIYVKGYEAAYHAGPWIVKFYVEENYEGVWEHAVTLSFYIHDVTAPTVPGTPSDGGAWSSNDIVTWKWASSYDNNGVGEYQIKITSSTGQETVESAGTAISFTKAGLYDGVKYWARVRARNSDPDYVAWSDWSSSSDGISIDLSHPTLMGLEINGGARFASSRAVHLSIQAEDPIPGLGLVSSGLCDMRLREVGGLWGKWEAWSSSRDFAFSKDGIVSVEVQVRDCVGHESSTAIDSIHVDTIPPSLDVTIDSNSGYVNSVDVVVSVNANDMGTESSGVVDMCLRNDGDSYGSWEQIRSSVQWSLASGPDGERKVWVMVRDAAGNEAEATTTVVLDTMPPNVTLLIDGGSTWTMSPNVEITIDATDSAPLDTMRIRNEGEAWSSTQPFMIAVSWTLEGATDGIKRVFVEISDLAGNWGVANSTIILDTEGAYDLVLLLEDGVAYTQNLTVHVSIYAQDATSGVCTYSLREGSRPWTPPAHFASTIDWTFEDTSDGEHMLSLRVFDCAGNPSNVIQASIILDQTPPTVSLEIRGGATTVNSLDVALIVDAEDPPQGSGIVEAITLSNDGVQWSSWLPFNSEVDWRLEEGPDGQRTIHITVRDAAGNDAESSVIVVLDTIAPNVALFIEGNSTWTSSTGVHLVINAWDSTPLDAIYIRNEGEAWGTPQPFLDTVTWTLEGSTDGSKRVFVRVSDIAGNWGEANSTIILDTKGPHNVALLLESGSSYTQNVSIHVSMYAQDATSGVCTYSLQEDSRPWVPLAGFVSATAWTFEDTSDGEHMLSLRVFDCAGNPSQVIQATIILDQTPPAVSLEIESGATAVNSLDVLATVAAEDPSQGSGIVEVLALSNDGVQWSSWLPFNSEVDWRLGNGPDGERTVYISVRDAAGNIGIAQANVFLDRTKPIVSLVVNGGDYYITSRDILLTIDAEDPKPGSGLAELQLLEEGESWTSPEAVVDSKFYTLADREGEHTLSIRVTDSAGNYGEVSVTIFLDTRAPTNLLVVPNSGALQTSSLTLSLEVSASDPDPGSGLALMTVRDDSGKSTGWIPYSPTLGFTLSDGPDSVRYIYFSIQDEAGNIAPETWTWITVNRQNTSSPYVPPDDNTETGQNGSSTLTVIAVLEADKEQLSVGHMVTFTVKFNRGSESDVAAYNFDFGDGTSSGWITNARALHIYVTTGLHTVTLHIRTVDNSPTDDSVVYIMVLDDSDDTTFVWTPWLFVVSVFLALIILLLLKRRGKLKKTRESSDSES